MEQSIHAKKIGIFGGSFDPVHQGHLNIAESAWREFELDEVWFVPSGHSPHKDEREMVPAEIRAKLIELAIDSYHGFCLSRIEMDEPGISYTYRTLGHLKQQYPKYEFYFIMGADSLDYFEHWKHPEIICENAVVLVAVRDQVDLSGITERIARIRSLFPARIEPIRGGRTEVSSTEIRRQLAAGERPKMLPDAVWDYIQDHGLYGIGQKPG